ncbi:MAG: type II secretion system F family protein [Phycisphaerales bacterium]|nr:type II secretion system F family protein [Phycisphaerales bacterium]
MPAFAYQGIDEQGRVVSGTITASSRNVAMERIRSMGQQATEIIESKTGSASSKAQNRPTISAVELANLMRELATAVEAGLPLMQGLVIVRRQAANPRQETVLDFLIERVESGRPLHEACREYGPPFDDMVVGMIRAADASGKMHEVLHQLSDLLERSVEVRRELVGATIYPMIVMVIMAISVAIFVTILLPKLMVPLQAQNVPLPWPTQVLLAIADFFAAWWWLMIAAAIGGFFGWRAWTAVPKNRRIVDGLLLRVPLLGNLLRDIAVARFTRTLGTLCSAGIPILTALGIVRDTLGNTVMMDAIDDVRERVTTGGSLATPLERCGHFPPLLVQIVNIGERSGRLEGMLLHAASAFDRQVNNSLKIFTKALPPVMLVIMACVAAFVLSAILLPMLEMQEAVAGGR